MKISRGDVFLVEVVFSDRSGAKLRPALILSGSAYNRDRQEVIIAAITSNVDRLLPGDTKISDWKAAGLKLPSVLTAIVQTVKKSLLQKRLGTLSAADFTRAEPALHSALGFKAGPKS